MREERGARDANGADVALSGLTRFTELGNVSPVREEEKHKTTVDTNWEGTAETADRLRLKSAFVRVLGEHIIPE